MKLIIRRDQEQKKGILGGNKGVEFSLYCKVDLTAEQKALVSKYQIGGYEVATYKGFAKQDKPFVMTVNGLSNGITSNVNDVTELLALEDKIKEACGTLKTLLDVMATFGGEEVVEF